MVARGPPRAFRCLEARVSRRKGTIGLVLDRNAEMEEDCREFVRQLQRVWDGRTGRNRPAARVGERSAVRQTVTIKACMISCLRRLSAGEFHRNEEKVGIRPDY